MDARRESLLDPAGVRALLSPSVLVSLALALTAAVLALAYLFRGGVGAPAARNDAPAASAPGPAGAAAGSAAALPAALPEPVEFRCVDGLRVRKQGSSYTSDGPC